MAIRLAPTSNADSEHFWNGVREHRLLVQRCTACGVLRHPPGPMCPRCHSVGWDTIESSGRGEVYSFVMPRHPSYPWSDEHHIVVLVELAEGVRFVSNLCDVAPGDVTIGMPVEVFYETFDGDVVLPQFRPAGAA